MKKSKKGPRKAGLVAAAAAAVLSVGFAPAFAQQQSQQQQTNQQRNAQNMVATSSLVGTKVMDSQKNQVGTISNIFVDPQTGKIQRADIDFNKRLFPSERTYSVRWDQLSFERNGNNMVATLEPAFINRVRGSSQQQNAAQQQNSSQQQNASNDQGQNNQGQQYPWQSGQNQQMGQNQNYQGQTQNYPGQNQNPEGQNQNYQAQSQNYPEQNENYLTQGRNQRQISVADLSSADISKLQHKLNKEGFAAGHVNGRWGQDSQTALRNFQQFKGIPATGELDQRTVKALGLDFDRLRVQNQQFRNTHSNGYDDNQSNQ